MTGGRLRQVSLVGAVVAVVAVSLGTAAGLVVVPAVGSYLGMLVGGFLAGVAIEDRPVFESGFAGALAAIGVLWSGAFLGSGAVEAVTALGSIEPTALLSSALLSSAVGAFGAHLGDDLREGLTTPVETPPSGPTTTGPTPVASSEEESSLQASDERATRSDAVGTEPDRTEGSESREAPGRERVESEELALERE